MSIARISVSNRDFGGEHDRAQICISGLTDHEGNPVDDVLISVGVFSGEDDLQLLVTLKGAVLKSTTFKQIYAQPPVSEVAWEFPEIACPEAVRATEEVGVYQDTE